MLDRLVRLKPSGSMAWISALSLRNETKAILSDVETGGVRAAPVLSPAGTGYGLVAGAPSPLTQARPKRVTRAMATYRASTGVLKPPLVDDRKKANK